MASESSKTRHPAFYTDAFQAVLPGLLLGFMFLVVSFASKSAADSEQRAIERSLAAKPREPEEQREEIYLHSGVIDASPLKVNIITATETGLRRLNTPEKVASLERVTIEIDLPQSNGADQSSSHVPLELLELLSRRASLLQFQLTLHVAPANGRTAMLWIDAIRKNAEPGQIVDISRIAVSLNKNMPLDKLKLDVLRTKKMVIRQESQE